MTHIYTHHITVMLESSVNPTSINWLAERYGADILHAPPPPTHTHKHSLAHKSCRPGLHLSLFPPKCIIVVWRQQRQLYCRWWHKASVRPFRRKACHMVSGPRTRVWGDDEENLSAHIRREFGKNSCGRTVCAALLWLAWLLVIMQKHTYVAWSVGVRYYSECTIYTCLHFNPP
jgi:hypothetical protein